ncbi:MAG: hypothetical protein KYX68_12040 [Flavobacterium sp.]|nr:hypothetical protein [Flavobacterium sp.]
MKTRIITSILGAFLMAMPSFAQDKTTVRANSSDISDNLDLRAVATIFGDSKDLEDFEQRLNDPKSQISNLDLNGDNYVDYLRVVESVEGNAHIIVIQAVLEKDVYQDVASVEVERDRDNNIQVQVVGDVYMYGANYIYEPVYVHRPVIYTTFWVTNYRPYCSSWYWGYYPSYFYYWNPWPVFRYRNNIIVHINFGHSYHYVTHRRCSYAYNAYYGRRGNGYERRYPNRSFASRHQGYSNRYELDQNRTIKTRVAGSRELAYNSPRSSNGNVSPRENNSAPRTSAPRVTNSNPRATNDGVKPRSYTNESSPRNSSPREYSSNTPRTSSSPKTYGSSSGNSNPRSYNEPRKNNNTLGNGSSSPRNYGSSSGNSNPRSYNEPRRNNSSMSGGNSTPRSSGGSFSGSRGSSNSGNSSRGNSSHSNGGGRGGRA